MRLVFRNFVSLSYAGMLLLPAGSAGAVTGQTPTEILTCSGAVSEKFPMAYDETDIIMNVLIFRARQNFKDHPDADLYAEAMKTLSKADGLGFFQHALFFSPSAGDRPELRLLAAKLFADFNSDKATALREEIVNATNEEYPDQAVKDELDRQLKEVKATARPGASGEPLKTVVTNNNFDYVHYWAEGLYLKITRGKFILNWKKPYENFVGLVTSQKIIDSTQSSDIAKRFTLSIEGVEGDGSFLLNIRLLAPQLENYWLGRLNVEGLPFTLYYKSKHTDHQYLQIEKDLTHSKLNPISPNRPKFGGGGGGNNEKEAQDSLDNKPKAHSAVAGEKRQ